MTTTTTATMLRSTWRQTGRPESRAHWYNPSMERCLRELRRCDGARALFEVRDARVPDLSHPFFDSLLRRPRSCRRLICFTHADLVHDDDRDRIRAYGRAISAGRSPLMMNLSNYKAGPDPSTKVIRSTMIDFLNDVYGDERNDDHRPMKSFAIGFPNVGKSSFLYVSTKTQTQLVKKKRTHHLPKVANVAGHTTVLKPHWLSLHDPPARVLDTPGVNLPREFFLRSRDRRRRSPESWYKLALIGALPWAFYASEAVDVLDYLLFRLNRSGRFDYVDELNLSGPTDDVEQLIATLDDNDGRSREQLVADLIRQWRQGRFGRIVLDNLSI